MNLLWWIIAFSFIGGVFSLVGGVALLMNREWVKRHSCALVSFAAGVLLSISFLDLLPEAVEMAMERGLEVHELLLWPFAAMIGFFFLERSFVWFHHHHEPDMKPPTNLMILLGDSLHNFVDGIVIVASFLVSVPMGIMTALAVAAHEVPQEIADFGIFLKSGMKPKKVFWVNLGSALMTVVGAIMAYGLMEKIEAMQAQLLAFTAGMFTYIAASDLIPELHHEKSRKVAWKQSVALVIGIMTMKLLIGWAHH